MPLGIACDTTERLMVTLTRVVLAARIEFGMDGKVTSIHDEVGDREEFVVPAVPAMPKFWLVFFYENAPAEPFGFHVAAEVRTSTSAVAMFDCGDLHTRARSGQWQIEIPVLVNEVGPQTVSLWIDRQKAWEQVIFFALSE
jgi:hypothetical protein